MSCASCVGRVERALRTIPGVSEANVNLATERASVRGNAGVEVLIAAVANAGFTARPLVRTGTEADKAAEKKDAEQAELKRELTIAAIPSLPVFLMEMGPHLIPGIHHLVMNTIGLENSWYIQFALASPVLFGPGLRPFKKGCRRCCVLHRT